MSGYADRYFYPGTATLINHFGIKDPEELERVEAFYSRLALRQPILPAIEFTSDGLKQIHHHFFHQIYPWGEFRTVDMVKLLEPGQPPVRFAPGAHIARVEMPRFCGELRYDVEVGRSFERLDRKTFGYRAAVYMADLNHIHPFPEGNGRTQRILLDHMAARAGFRLHHGRIVRDAWLAATIDSVGQDSRGGQFTPHVKMTELIAEAVEPAA